MSAGGEHVLVALAVDGRGFHEDVLDLAAIAAGIHLQRAADGARHAAQEFEARDARIGRRARHGAIERRRAGADARAVHARSCRKRRAGGSPRRECRRRAPEDWSRRRSRRPRCPAGRAARNVARSSASAGRNRTSAAPPARNHTRSFSGGAVGIGAAHRGKQVARPGHHAALQLFERRLQTCAQAVIEPAPRHTMAPPGLACGATAAARSASPVDGHGHCDGRGRARLRR